MGRETRMMRETALINAKTPNDYPIGRGKLINGLPGLDLQSLPRCSATAKHSGKRCGQPCVKGKTKCRWHGGRSSGPKTTEGRDAIRKANTRHGRYSQEFKACRREYRELVRELRAALGRPDRF
jgi:hypothetical protein